MIDAGRDVATSLPRPGERVTIGEFGGAYRLDVADDGVGIQGAQNGDAGHLGMGSMVRRADEVAGRCDVRPNEPAGTRVEVWIPDMSSPAAEPLIPSKPIIRTGGVVR